MTREETIKRIEKLKEMKLPHVTAKDVIKDLSRFTKEDIELLDKYFDRYVMPSGLISQAEQSHKCVWCDKALYLEWSIMHGETHCTKCGYQSTGFHHPIISNDTKLDRIAFNLQYHPDGLYVDQDENEGREETQ